MNLKTIAAVKAGQPVGAPQPIAARYESEADNAFKALLDTALSQGTIPSQGTQETPEKVTEKPEAENKSVVQDKDTEADTTAAQSETAAMIASPAEIAEPLPETGMETTVQIEAVDTLSTASQMASAQTAESLQPAPQQPLAIQPDAAQTAEKPEQMEGIPVEDILSTEAIVTQAKPEVSTTESNVVQANLEQADPMQQRFDSMVAEAARKLAGGQVPEQAPETIGADESIQQETTQTGQSIPAAELEVKTEQVETTEQTLAQTAEADLAKQDSVVQDSAKAQRSTVRTEDSAIQAAVESIRPESQQQVETVQEVKQAAQPQATPSEQIQTQIIEHLEQEKMEFHMQLNPRELGRIDVKMVLESGRLTVQVTAASAKTAELLTRQMEGLASSLRVSGVNLHQLQVVHASDDAKGAEDQQPGSMAGESRQSEQDDEQPGTAAHPNANDDLEAEEDILPQEEQIDLLNYTI